MMDKYLEALEELCEESLLFLTIAVIVVFFAIGVVIAVTIETHGLALIPIVWYMWIKVKEKLNE